MFCALCSENRKNGSNPGGRGKQWVERNERKVREEKEKREASMTLEGWGRKEVKVRVRSEAIVGGIPVVLPNLLSVVYPPLFP